MLNNSLIITSAKWWKVCCTKFTLFLMYFQRDWFFLSTDAYMLLSVFFNFTEMCFFFLLLLLLLLENNTACTCVTMHILMPIIWYNTFIQSKATQKLLQNSTVRGNYATWSRVVIFTFPDRTLHNLSQMGSMKSMAFVT